MDLTGSDFIELYRKIGNDPEISVPTLVVLCTLYDGEKHKVSEIVEQLNMPRPRIANRLAVLDSLGLVRKWGRGWYTLSQRGAEIIERNFPKTYATARTEVQE